MVAGSRSSLRRPLLRGDHKSESPSQSPVIEPRQTPEDTTKRARISARSPEEERFRKRRRIAGTANSPQLNIPLRSKVPPKLVSPAIVTQPVLPPLQSHVVQPLDSPKTQYDQIKFIEEKARVAIRGGTFINPRDDKRSLRSQDGGSRSKSELAQYFNNYEQMLSLEPMVPDPLTAQTRIILVDDTPGFKPKLSDDSGPESVKSDPFGASKPLHNAQKLDLSKYVVNSRRYTTDPLDKDMFSKAYKVHERLAKQIRNSEKEKSLHEKVQLDRLLDELRGPDWLRVMGISGITESEKKRYEPKRALFIQEIKTMIEKFKHWKEMEKSRRKKELEMLSVTGGESDAEEDADDEQEEDDDEDEVEEDEIDEDEEDEDAEDQSSPVASPDKDLVSDDALAARQLLQEAKSAHKPRKNVVELPPLPPPPPPPHVPFTSFYSKRHLRDAAIGIHGRRSRGITAFGQPVPELEDQDFELPDSILTEDAIRARQRNKRRVRRGSDT